MHINVWLIILTQNTLKQTAETEINSLDKNTNAAENIETEYY